MLTSFRDQDGKNLVAEWRPTSIVREHAPKNAEAMPAGDGRWPTCDSEKPATRWRGSPVNPLMAFRSGAVTMPPLSDIVRYGFASGEDCVAHYDH